MKDGKLGKVILYPLSLAAFNRLTLVNYGNTADKKRASISDCIKFIFLYV